YWTPVVCVNRRILHGCREGCPQVVLLEVRMDSDESCEILQTSQKHRSSRTRHQSVRRGAVFIRHDHSLCQHSYEPENVRT
ncbi:hypothetical protein PENTCL1PPCAC_27227, partial [Pristionchus entomophagus]